MSATYCCLPKIYIEKLFSLENLGNNLVYLDLYTVHNEPFGNINHFKSLKYLKFKNFKY